MIPSHHALYHIKIVSFEMKGYTCTRESLVSGQVGKVVFSLQYLISHHVFGTSFPLNLPRGGGLMIACGMFRVSSVKTMKTRIEFEKTSANHDICARQNMNKNVREKARVIRRWKHLVQ
jgi:hypothetical protein